ncbi:hypothetical protein Osc7112_2205 [Oscillatoria nigro-viridis PCC 7112]|uniref:Uncharacterized protein n=1 Tax=Phormidium nigroviride PCC 7112 TaxID=179408 RepID=K9VGQ9_9CYAN|nr:hypothetical protein [Oscillatoria nigro-viridis]AFZ06667.1 hypothetical protein Osc7112_2205 [Oscillatoria nigro-viridis PCC 7112]
MIATYQTGITLNNKGLIQLLTLYKVLDISETESEMLLVSGGDI